MILSALSFFIITYYSIAHFLSYAFLILISVIFNVSSTWALPSRCPDGTQVYKNRALRTPFLKVSFEPAVQPAKFERVSIDPRTYSIR